MQNEITISVDQLEHLLLCADNACCLDSFKKEDKQEALDTIRKAIKLARELLNPVLVANRRSVAAQTKLHIAFDRDSNFLEEMSKVEKADDPYYGFKWYQLVLQELRFWASMGKDVDQDEFDLLCERRGFYKEQAEYLVKIVAEIGLGQLTVNKYHG